MCDHNSRSSFRMLQGWSPVYVEDNLGVMSIGFMLPNPDDAVIWRGPRKNGLIKQVGPHTLLYWGVLEAAAWCGSAGVSMLANFTNLMSWLSLSCSS